MEQKRERERKRGRRSSKEAEEAEDGQRRGDEERRVCRGEIGVLLRQ